MYRSLASTALSFAFIACAHAQGATQDFSRIEHGRYLTTLSDCAGCHTAPGGEPFAGGVPLQTPFGTLIASNITPDTDTGIGNWSDDEFVSALQEGRGRNGTRLYPAMPYTAYTRMSRDDILAMRAYLATVTPVHHEVHSNQLPFPFNIRLAMMAWNWLNFTPGRFVGDPHRSAEWNRGAYLVQSPGHCGTCHTPKTFLGGDKTDLPLAGATLQGWFAPNITANRHNGVGLWSKDNLIGYLKTGANEITLASGPMADVVTHSTSRMKDSDVAAIAVYLLGTGDNMSDKPAPLAADNPAMKAGAAIYKDACAACHRDNGVGEAQLFPRLAGSSIVQSGDPTTLGRIVLEGSRAVATDSAPTAPAMPAFDWRLDNDQVAAVLTYIRNSWGNVAPAVTGAAIAKQRTSLAHSR